MLYLYSCHFYLAVLEVVVLFTKHWLYQANLAFASSVFKWQTTAAMLFQLLCKSGFPVCSCNILCQSQLGKPIGILYSYGTQEDDRNIFRNIFCLLVLAHMYSQPYSLHELTCFDTIWNYLSKHLRRKMEKGTKVRSHRNEVCRKVEQVPMHRMSPLIDTVKQ